jgi:competence protein ComEC
MKRLILFISLIGLIGMFWLTLPKTKPVIIVCDVGQGDAILATYKNIQILFDVGPDNKKVLKCLENHLPFWDKTIEAVVLSHGDSDHTGGLNDLTKVYKVKNFFSNGYLDKDIEQKIYSRKLSQNDIVSLSLFNFEVVWPEENPGKEIDGNENSVAGILRVENKDWSMLLTGDMEKEAEQKLVWRQVLLSPIKVLKVSHHGSESATSEELLQVIKPKTAVISVGKNNKFGHPREEVIERLKNIGGEILRTDILGDITIEVD